jgi:hypothetical protein
MSLVMEGAQGIAVLLAFAHGGFLVGIGGPTDDDRPERPPGEDR